MERGEHSFFGGIKDRAKKVARVVALGAALSGPATVEARDVDTVEEAKTAGDIARRGETHWQKVDTDDQLSGGTSIRTRKSGNQPGFEVLTDEEADKAVSMIKKIES